MTKTFIDNRTRIAIISRFKQGDGATQISKEMVLNKTSVQSIIDRFRKDGVVTRKKSPGRPKVTTSRQDRRILSMIKKNSFISACEIKRQQQLDISIRTIRNRIRAGGFKARRPAHKPLLSLKNRQARLLWAKRHKDWDIDKWKKIIWSDETKIQLFHGGGSGNILVYRRPLTRLQPCNVVTTIKHGGGNILLWGAFTWDGVLLLKRIEETMNSEKFQNLITNSLLPFYKANRCKGLIFQLDNDPKHSSHSTKLFFANHRVNVLDWPSQSPDINPIENLWSELKTSLRGQHFSNSNALFEACRLAWEKIPVQCLRNLIISMPKQCQTVIDNHGLWRKY